jgi:hypothetical protein
MKKAPSTILATAGITVGLLGFALPASASTAVFQPGNGPSTPASNPIKAPWPVDTTKGPDPVKTTQSPGPVKTTQGPDPVKTTQGPDPIKAPWPVHTAKAPDPIKTTEVPWPVHTTKGPQPPPPNGDHHGKPPYKGYPAPKPAPKQVCHRVPGPPHLTAQEKKLPSWQQPKHGSAIKCTTVKPVHHNPPPPPHKVPAPKKHHPWYWPF